MDGYVTIGTNLDTKSFEAQIREIEYELEQIDYELSHKKELKLDSRTIDEYSKKAEILSNKLIDLRKKQEDLNKTDLLNNIGTSIEGITKKVARWGLAVFGVRSAYMFVRQAMGTLSQYDEKISADIQYIRFALANTLKPVIEAIINLVYKLLAYIGYIAKAWFGVNLFANASVKAFQKTNKALQGTNKSAKQLQKTLAGFDEMNILQENGSTSVGGGGGGIELPTQDLADLGNIKTPQWLEWIGKNKKDILRILAAIAGAFVVIKKGYGIVKGLGIGIAIAGIIRAIEKVIDFINDPSFENFTGILEGVAIAVTGVAIAVGAWPVAFAGAIALVVIEIVRNFDKIKEFFNNLLEWMDKNFLGTLKNIFGPIGNLIYMPFEWAITIIKSLFENVYGGIKKIIEGIIKIFQGDFKNGILLIFGGLGDILLAPFRALYDGAKVIIDRIIGFVKDAIDWWNRLIGKETEAQQKARDYNAGGGGYGKGGGAGGGYSGGGARAKGAIFYPSMLPKLAVGGIINNPGPGVPYHGAVIGERGAEAVVPLTDSQQMELLGATIGRYITINANITTEMNGRVISKELQKINAENDFAYNR